MSTRLHIQPIVEGHGEVQAVPVLLRRLIDQASAYEIEVGRPIRQKQSQLLREESLRTAVRLARMQRDCGAILILFEQEDDCPKELGPRLCQWAQSEARDVPCTVVLAHREYESWFLASMESLRGKRGIRNNAMSHPTPETVRDAKGAVGERMESDYRYSETTDQPALSALFDMKATYIRSRSFRHLVKVFGDVLERMRGIPLDNWPPRAWIAEQ